MNRLVIIGLTLILAACFSSKKEKRLNQIQVIGSHNSYKMAIDSNLFKFLLARDSQVIGLDYHHLPLKEQLDLGLRGLEIDVSHDPTGGRYQSPRGIAWAKEVGINLKPHDTLKLLSQPGMKVLHVADIDFKSNCLTFKICLNEVKEWSAAHAGHDPIFITINTKDSGLDRPDATKVLPFTLPVLDSLDAEILSVFSKEELITPFYVKGKSKNVREAILTNGWPALSSVKGKIMIILDSPDGITNLYIKENKERPMFVNVGEDNANAAFFIMNEPIEQKYQIQALLRKGYMVRTRADADTKEARLSDYARWEAAKSTGAQLISTDYYLSNLSPTKKFEISFGGKYVRDNDFTLHKEKDTNDKSFIFF